ncbi:MAG: hypothetical protein ACFB9M_08330 [Myxococcota bacterium]
MARKKEADKLLGPDAFQEGGAPWVAWLEKNVRLVLLALGTILVGIVGFQMAGSSSARSASEVTAALGDALESYQRVSSPQFASTATSTQMLKQAYGDAQNELRRFRSEHSDRGAARLALLYEADLAARQEAYRSAADLYGAYLDSAVSNDPLRFIALEGQGYAYESLGEYSEALRVFELLAEIPFAQAYALKHQARVLEADGQVEEARSRLQLLLETEPSLFLQNYAENRLKLLR